jgi:hypothetical protein
MPAPPPERSVLSLIRDLQAGRVKPLGVSAAERRTCVEHLSLEGYQLEEIAEVFKVAVRTIQRDRELIRGKNALVKSPELLSEMAGDLVRQSQLSIGRLRRIGREKEAPAQARVDAERAIMATIKGTFDILQSVGYFPTAPAKFTAHVRHEGVHGTDDDDPDAGFGFDELQDQVNHLQRVMDQEVNANPALALEARQIKGQFDRLKLSSRVENALAALPAPVIEMPEAHDGDPDEAPP